MLSLLLYLMMSIGISASGYEANDDSPLQVHTSGGEGWKHTSGGEGWKHTSGGEGWKHTSGGEGWKHQSTSEGWTI